jgi:hypothetical protein
VVALAQKIPKEQQMGQGKTLCGVELSKYLVNVQEVWETPACAEVYISLLPCVYLCT